MWRYVTPVVLLVAVGCAGSEDTDQGETRDGLVPANARALVAIALEHTDIDPDFFTHPTEEPDRIGITMRFNADSPERGDLLTVAVATETSPGESPCVGPYDGCETVSTEDGDVTVLWQEEIPESDPGSLLVVKQTEDTMSTAYYAGDAIVGDPRESDLEVDVDDMIAIVTDPRFGFETDEELTTAPVAGFPKDDPTASVPVTTAYLVGELMQMFDDPDIAYEVNIAPARGPAVAVEAQGARVIGFALESDEIDGLARCPEDWECFEHPARPQQTYAWSDGIQMVTYEADDGSLGVVIEQGPTVPEFNPDEPTVPLLFAVTAEAMRPEVPSARAENPEADSIWDGERIPADLPRGILAGAD